MNTTANTILTNLSEFYKACTVDGNLQFGREHKTSWVLSEKGFWPSALVGGMEPLLFQEALVKIEKRELPSVWIIDRDIDTKFSDLLMSSGFYEVARWQGMMLEKTAFRAGIQQKDGYELKRIETFDALRSWLEVLYAELLKDKKISERVLHGWLTNKDIQLYGGYLNNQIASIGISYTHGNTSGLYLIATKKEYTNQRLATLLVSDLIKTCFKNGSKHIILHSSPSAINLYLRLGFKAVNEVSVYWKLGIF